MAEDNVVGFPKAKRHNWRTDGNISLKDKDKLVWEICKYLKNDETCEGCSEFDEDPVYGKTVRGCRVRADEVINICQTGNPWRK